MCGMEAAEEEVEAEATGRRTGVPLTVLPAFARDLDPQVPHIPCLINTVLLQSVLAASFLTPEVF